MTTPFWPDERINNVLDSTCYLVNFPDGNRFKMASQHDIKQLLYQIRNEMQAKIDSLERENNALAQGYREILAELEAKEKPDA